MRKEIEASGKPLRKGINEPDPASNIREYSVEPNLKQDIEVSARQDKKANTESKAVKGDLSGAKSKTEVKEAKENKELKQITEEKVALAPSAKRETRQSGSNKAKLASEVKESQRSKKREPLSKSKEEKPDSAEKSKKRGRPASSKDKEDRKTV